MVGIIQDKSARIIWNVSRILQHALCAETFQFFPRFLKMQIGTIHGQFCQNVSSLFAVCRLHWRLMPPVSGENGVVTPDAWDEDIGVLPARTAQLDRYMQALQSLDRESCRPSPRGHCPAPRTLACRITMGADQCEGVACHAGLI